MRWSRLRLFVQALSLAASILVLSSGVCWISGWVSVACPYGGILRILSLRFLMLALAVAFALPVLLTVFLGRFFCGWLCPVGAALDIYRCILPVKGSGRKGSPALSMALGTGGKYLFAGAFILLSYLCRYPIFCVVCPVRGICGLGRLKEAGLSLLPVALAPFLFEAWGSRSWCRHVCPLGGFLGLLSIVKPVGLKVDPEKCRNCKVCTLKCRFDALTPGRLAAGRPARSECVLCMECVDECRFGAISLGIGI